MPTDKVLKTINVFPDEETFEQNEASLQDGELSLVPVRVVKTINGSQPDAAGNVTLDTGLGGAHVEWRMSHEARIGGRREYYRER